MSEGSRVEMPARPPRPAERRPAPENTEDAQRRTRPRRDDQAPRPLMPAFTEDGQTHLLPSGSSPTTPVQSPTRNTVPRSTRWSPATATATATASSSAHRQARALSVIHQNVDNTRPRRFRGLHQPTLMNSPSAAASHLFRAGGFEQTSASATVEDTMQSNAFGQMPQPSAPFLETGRSNESRSSVAAADPTAPAGTDPAAGLGLSRSTAGVDDLPDPARGAAIQAHAEANRPW